MFCTLPCKYFASFALFCVSGITASYGEMAQTVRSGLTFCCENWLTALFQLLFNCEKWYGTESPLPKQAHNTKGFALL